MKDYDPDALRELCSQINLLEYAEESMDFEKRGSDSYATSCPLHSDKTPSLIISPSKNVFYCQSCHRGGNIINWMMIYEKLSFPQTIQKISDMTGMNLQKLKRCSSFLYYKDLKRLNEKEGQEPIEREILPDSAIEQFSDEVPQEWVEEGILPEVMKIFEIRIDKDSNRIVYPVYDSYYELIGFKGRTRYENFKKLKIQKYMNYTKIKTTDFFTGMKYTAKYIYQKNEIIIFEGLKSVMKAYGWGYKNCVSAETSCLNEYQIEIIIKEQIKNVVIAFDSDVSFSKIYNSLGILKKFCNVFIVQDRTVSRLLKEEKMAPVDAGKEIWDVLYKERKKV